MKELFSQLAVGTHINQITGKDAGTYGNETTLQSTIPAILSTIIGILALVAVVVIIIGGIGYMTSSGDSGKVKKAKDTILYGLIGLAVCALSFAIVNWVAGSVLGGAE